MTSRAPRQTRTNDRAWSVGPDTPVLAPATSPLAAALDTVFGAMALPEGSDVAWDSPDPLCLDLLPGKGETPDRLLVGGVPIGHVPRGSLAPMVEAAVIGHAVRGRRDCAAFHAGAVELGGRAVLLIGDKGSGKSTLSLFLGYQGGNYLGDEVALIRYEDARLVPFPKAATIKAPSFELFEEQEAHPDPIRGPVRYYLPWNEETIIPESVEIAMVVAPRFDARAHGVIVEQLSPEDVALSLVRQCFGGLERDRRTLELVRQLSELPARSVVYSKASCAAEAIRSEVGR